MLANPGRAIYLLLARTSRRCRTGCAAWPSGSPRSRKRCPRRVLNGGPAAQGAPGDRAQPVRRNGTPDRGGTGPRAHRGASRAGAGRPGGRAGRGAGRDRGTSPLARAAAGRRLQGGGSQDGGFRDPRIGPELFARKLQLTLESGGSAEELFARAQADLDEATGQIIETAARLGRSAGDGSSLAAEDGGRGDLGATSLIRWRPTRPMTARSSAWSAGPTTSSWRSSASTRS